MDRIALLITLIPAAPLIAAVLIPLLAPRIGRRFAPLASLLTIAGIAVSCLASLSLVREISYQHEHLTREGRAYQRVVVLWTWANVTDAYHQQLAPPADTSATSDVEGGVRDFAIDIALRADALTAMMLAMVTFISLLVRSEERRVG